MTSAPEISGLCPPRFHAVKDAFAANFTDAPDGLNEQAARFSVVIAGETVLDLWAGVADPREQTPFTDKIPRPRLLLGQGDHGPADGLGRPARQDGL